MTLYQFTLFYGVTDSVSIYVILWCNKKLEKLPKLEKFGVLYTQVPDEKIWTARLTNQTQGFKIMDC